MLGLILKTKNIVVGDDIELLCFDSRILCKAKELVSCLIGKDFGSTTNDSYYLRSVEDQVLELLSHRPSSGMYGCDGTFDGEVTALDQLQPHKVSLSDGKGSGDELGVVHPQAFHDALPRPYRFRPYA